jgi:hypothetical protein
MEFDNGTEQKIDSEMTQLVRAITKEEARKALVTWFEKEGNGAILIEARINDTITHNGEII